MVDDEHVQSGGVAASHLEPVERAERELDGVVRLEPAPARGHPAGEETDAASGAHTVPPDGPHRVLGRDDRRIELLDLGGVGGRLVEAALQLGEGLRDRLGAVLQAGARDGVAQQRPGAGRAAQRFVDAGEPGGDVGDHRRGRDRARPVQPGERVVEQAEQRREVGLDGVASASQHGDDSAHVALLPSGRRVPASLRA
ncbi:MAG: hypothetical protein KatS3mg010_1286 [Acidimicrobiia bacterium]|nr:MAG: hypothetical protein KatS3mg010_1286 [Acidimicrobiia bacterium]